MDFVHSKGWEHDPKTALPLETWPEGVTTPEEHTALIQSAVDPGSDPSVGAILGFPLNPPQDRKPTLEAVEEVYGLSVIRDIPFSSWHSDATVRSLVERMAHHKGIAMMNGLRQDTGDTSGILPGQDKTFPGPFVSQFLMHDVPAGPYVIERLVRTQANYGAKRPEAAAMFSGELVEHRPNGPFLHVAETPRSLGRAIENDYPGQHWVHAWLILMNKFKLRAQGHPDAELAQVDWCDGGIGNLQKILFDCIDAAMRVTWQAGKWHHKHIRPAPFGAYLDNEVASGPLKHYLELEFVKLSRQQTGNFLLPVATRGGEPNHGEFPPGHDTCEGVGSTLTRSFFDPNDDTPWPDHVRVAATDPAGTMTIGSEALKQADNLGAARRMLGVHWNYSSVAGRAVGEKITRLYLAANGYNVPAPVWEPLWLDTIERLGLPTTMHAGPSSDEEE